MTRSSSRLKSGAGFAAAIAALGAVCAAVIALGQPLIARLVDDYWNRTSDIRIADAQFAVTTGGPALDIVVVNQTKIAQIAIAVEVTLSQEGPPLMMIGHSEYQFFDEITIERGSGMIGGHVQGENKIIYPFSGKLVVPFRGGWSLDMTIPVRENFGSGESRSILFLVPNITKVATRGRYLTSDLFINQRDTSWETRYFSGTNKDELRISDFLMDKRTTALRVLIKRADGRTALYNGLVTF